MNDPRFYDMIEDILAHPQFQQLKDLPHHGPQNSVYDHSLDTAWCAYRMARKLHMEEDRVRALTRAALLHDFFGYDWHDESHRRFLRRYSGLRRLTHMHAFVHGARAAHRADRTFGLDERQKAAITSHMFPLAPMPRSGEAWLLTLADKVVASREMCSTANWHVKRLYNGALRANQS